MRISKKTHNQCKQIARGTYRFTRASSFPYLGSIINDDVIIFRRNNTELKKGNRAYYAYKG